MGIAIVAGERGQLVTRLKKMNRSFLIIILPAIAVGIGYILVLRWLGYELQPFRFVMAGIVAVAAVILVQRYQRRKGARKSGS